MRFLLLIFSLVLFASSALAQREVMGLAGEWKFRLGADSNAALPGYNDGAWRRVTVPHDWSIEHDFAAHHPATNLGGALPGGIGWYRRAIFIPRRDSGKIIRIEFDGVYKNSEVFINGISIGKRPNGYVSFSYDITAQVQYGKSNLIAVKVDNSAQPDSRWYSGSGIYRNARLVKTGRVAVAQWGSVITTKRSGKAADVFITTTIENNSAAACKLRIVTDIIDSKGRVVATNATKGLQRLRPGANELVQKIHVLQPSWWSIEQPNQYTAVTRIISGKKIVDHYETRFGIREIRFEPTGFFLNGKRVFLKGVCMHHDLGALGAAIDISAMERQLRILKEMGCNAIRISHNPPAPEFLDLCDQMGFFVVNEALDMWRKKKTKFDYHLEFNQWHEADLRSLVLRDRNHPSVIMWSIGNEIREQFDSTGYHIAKRLATIVRSLDSTRPITSALTEMVPEKNHITRSGALDVLGFNYKDYDYPLLPQRFPGAIFIATETASALATRGVYQYPSDTNRVWPPDFRSQENFKGGNADFTCAAYDKTYAYWGNTHERSWLAVKDNPHIIGAFVWSGFDYLGEPTPYPFPARSSYFGLVDLAGFPKDAYYLYQSEWTNKAMLHVLPHWNWKKGDTVDVWAYYNNADETELFLNGVSKGVRSKPDSQLHVSWRVVFEPGQITVVSRKNGRNVLARTVQTAGVPVKIRLTKQQKTANGNLSFITAELVDAKGNLVPNDDRLIRFTVEGPAEIAGTDNGYQADTNSLKKPFRSTWKGKALAIIKPLSKKRNITVKAESAGLPGSFIRIFP